MMKHVSSFRAVWLTLLCTIFVAACSSSGNGGATSQKATPSHSTPATLLRAPIKIPMPLDKAGHKVDVTFEVPPPPKGQTSRGYFVGLRVLFAPATDTVFDALAANPISARVLLYRLENGKEIPITLFKRRMISASDEIPRRYESFELPNDVANATPYYTEYSGAPPGTPDASTFVISLTSGPDGETPGVYRLKIETLKDLPALQGFKAFLVYEENPRR